MNEIRKKVEAKRKKLIKEIIVLANEIKKRKPKETKLAKSGEMIDIIYGKNKPYYKLVATITSKGELIEGFLEYEDEKKQIKHETIANLEELKKELKGIIKTLS